MYSVLVEKKIISRSIGLLMVSGILLLLAEAVYAVNINSFKDTLTDSGPGEQSNHSLSFILNTNVSGGAMFELTPPAGFTVAPIASTTFGVRNIEMLVNGVARTSGSALPSPGIDQVEITPGSPGFIRYTLAPDAVITSGSQIDLLIGNHTSTAVGPSEVFSTSTGTTTLSGDIEPIENSVVLGKHDVQLEIFDGGLVANADFVVFLNEKVNIPSVDTTEEIPPFRFNGAPTSTVTGVTATVQISLETDELADCRYATTPGVDFSAMTDDFENTGLIFHSHDVTVMPDQSYEFYIRCIDDEGNFNIDDYVISFTVTDRPQGEVNTEGDVGGDGSGTGNSGSGTGEEEGDNTGSGTGSGSDAGSSGGGSGGGGGGGSGGGSSSGGGGGFESTDAPYQSGDGRVIISGTAFPGSIVTALVDGNFFENTTANSSGIYSVTLDEIARGPYTFAVYAEGDDGVKSSTFSTSFTVTGARTSTLSNINIPPSILIEPDPVSPGETVTASGYALPNATITLENSRKNSSITKIITATSDGNGRWSAEIDTTGFSVDTYQIRAKAEQEEDEGDVTNFSEYTYYGVGQEAEGLLPGDLSRDGRVNLTDFSILLFWWNSNGGDSDPPADINQDGRVSLTDFSILLFNWTG